MTGAMLNNSRSPRFELALVAPDDPTPCTAPYYPRRSETAAIPSAMQVEVAARFDAFSWQSAPSLVSVPGAGWPLPGLEQRYASAWHATPEVSKLLSLS